MPASITIPSPGLFKHLNELTKMRQTIRDDKLDLSLSAVPEIDLMIYPYLCQTFSKLKTFITTDHDFRYTELNILSTRTEKVLHLKFAKNFTFRNGRYFNDGRFVMLF